VLKGIYFTADLFIFTITRDLTARQADPCH